MIRDRIPTRLIALAPIVGGSQVGVATSLLVLTALAVPVGLFYTRNVDTPDEELLEEEDDTVVGSQVELDAVQFYRNVKLRKGALILVTACLELHAAFWVIYTGVSGDRHSFVEQCVMLVFWVGRVVTPTAEQGQNNQSIMWTDILLPWSLSR